MKQKRPDQINVVIDAEIRQAIDDIRALTRPVPNVSAVVRGAILEKRDRLVKAEERRKQ